MQAEFTSLFFLVFPSGLCSIVQLYAIEFPEIFRITRKRDSAHEIGDVTEKSRNLKLSKETLIER